MKPGKLFIIIGIIALVGWKIFWHPKLSRTAFDFLSTYSAGNSTNLWGPPGPCDVTQEHCVYIYLAPWCPHCQATLPLIENYRNSWTTIDRPGLKVIVGNGDEDAINTMAANIAPPVYLDLHDKFLWALHVKYFPYYVVVDANQSIIASGEGGRHWVDKEIEQHLKK